MSQATEVTLRWAGDEAFEIVEPSSAGPILDGDRSRGLSPMDSLLTSLCGCMGIDVVMILLKMRAPLEGLEIRARGFRKDDPPRYFNRVELDFELDGDVKEKDVERAIDLSFKKYCSVFHSLRSDLETSHRIRWKSAK